MKRYRRRRPSKRPKPRVVVVTEGTVTEPGYLSSFHRIHGSDSVVVEPVPLRKDPRSVVERAISEREDAAADIDGERDTFWAMFDRDEFDNFKEALDLARGNGIPVAASNPCFELWPILHYELLDRPLDRHQCQRRLAELCPGYSMSSKRFEEAETIRDYHDQAVQRARTLIARRDRDKDEKVPLGNPSTTVHELTEHMRRWDS